MVFVKLNIGSFFGEYVFLGILIISFLMYVAVIIIFNLWSYKFSPKVFNTEIKSQEFIELHQFSWEWLLIPLIFLVVIFIIVFFND